MYFLHILLVLSLMGGTPHSNEAHAEYQPRRGGGAWRRPPGCCLERPREAWQNGHGDHGLVWFSMV